MWTSTADSKFFVTKDPRGDTLGRGTRVTLHLKDDALEYIEEDKIKNLVKKYSEFINYPISLYMPRTVDEVVSIETPETDRASTVERNEDDIEITTEQEQDASDTDEPKTKTIQK